MKLEQLRPELVQKAISLFLDEAYGSGSSSAGKDRGRKVPPEASSPEQVLALFNDETKKDRNALCHRYTMRLGNRNYPFMKIVIQEHLVADEYFFAVDTHDDMEIKPSYPDYDAWIAVRQFNQETKARIEAAWEREGIPTYAGIRQMVLDRDTARCAERAEKILVVDDERDIADTVESLLTSKGFSVIKVHDGLAALKEAAACAPDLIILDYELPELDGLQVIERLKRREETKEIPILLATACVLQLGENRKANGFLVKPFQEEALYLLVEKLLGARKA
jgi:CheY-like chemotaxis protein